MTVEQMVKYLRLNLVVQDPTSMNPDDIDPYFLAMSDEDLELFLNVSLSNEVFKGTFDYPTLDTLPQGKIKLLIMYAKKELYYTLATMVAPQVDIGADNNNYLKRDQRFQHYLKLIAQLEDEIKNALSDLDGGGGGTGGFLFTYDTTLPERYYTSYNYQKTVPPSVVADIVSVSDTSVEVVWKSSYLSKFWQYRIWVDKAPIFDAFNPNKIREDVVPIYSTFDPHEVMYRIDNLEKDTFYYVVVAVISRTGLTGYIQLECQTTT